MDPLTLPIPPGIDADAARRALALGLFQEGHVSVGKAAEIAGLSYRAFLDVLKERGIPAYVIDDDEAFGAEMETVRRQIREVEERRAP